MNAVAKRRWYLLCVVLGLIAVGAELYSNHHAGLGMQAMAQGAADKSSDDYRTVAERHAALSDIATFIGLLFAGLFYPPVGGVLSERRTRIAKRTDCFARPLYFFTGPHLLSET